MVKVDPKKTNYFKGLSEALALLSSHNFNILVIRIYQAELFTLIPCLVMSPNLTCSCNVTIYQPFELDHSPWCSNEGAYLGSIPWSNAMVIAWRKQASKDVKHDNPFEAVDNIPPFRLAVSVLSLSIHTTSTLMLTKSVDGPTLRRHRLVNQGW